MLLFYPYFKIKVLTYLLVGLLATQLDTDLCIHFSILYKSIEGKNCQNLQNLDNIYAKILPRTLSSGAVLGILRRSDASSMAASTAPFELQAAGLGASSRPCLLPIKFCKIFHIPHHIESLDVYMEY